MPCRRLSLLIALLLTCGSPAPAQQMIDAATAEAQYEAAFAAAPIVHDGDGMTGQVPR